eukprot:739797-Hanusia_phi.AAC.3
MMTKVTYGDEDGDDADACNEFGEESLSAGSHRIPALSPAAEQKAAPAVGAAWRTAAACSCTPPHSAPIASRGEIAACQPEVNPDNVRGGEMEEDRRDKIGRGEMEKGRVCVVGGGGEGFKGRRESRSGKEGKKEGKKERKEEGEKEGEEEVKKEGKEEEK